ncbi:hypothetical protein AUTU_16500 [Aureibacter tunicatorum]|nr:hypothetical protein AUTU_16500 [Aureibacter tunicatorum]
MLVVSLQVRGQIAGQLANNPSNLKWYRIKTDNFSVVFPKGFYFQANRVANNLEAIYLPVSSSLEVDPHHLTVILQNQGSISNGFVTMSPRRSEFFTTSPQNYNFLGTNDWLNLLSIHEFRHVVQYERAFQGPTKWFYWLFGEQSAGFLANISLPNWFWEGDAVVTETALTKSGRGRIPQFSALLRANVVEKGVFNYEKQTLRSFKDYIPNHYVTGYYLASSLRRSHGKDAWAEVLDISYRKPIRPWPWSRSVHDVSGQYVADFYDSTFVDLKEKWEHEIDELSLTEFRCLNQVNPKVYTDYMYPKVGDGGEVYCLRSGIGDILQLVKLDVENGDEKVLYTMGPFIDPGKISFGKETLVWSEYRYDPRWLRRSYADVFAYNVKTGKKRRLTKKERYFAPAISKDESKIVAVEESDNYTFNIVVLDASTGELVISFENEANNFYSMPSWSEDGTKIYVIKHFENGNALVELDVETEEERVLTDLVEYNIGYPEQFGEYVYINSAQSGIDNIYAVNLKTKELKQVTTSKFGAYNPSLNSRTGQLMYNDFRSTGMNVVSVDLDSLDWRDAGKVKYSGIDYYQPIVDQEEDVLPLLDSMNPTQYKEERYRTWKHLLEPYSWGLAVSSSDFQNYFGLVSQDNMSTMALGAGYQIDYNEWTGKWKADISYQGIYPIIDFGVSSGYRRATVTLEDGDEKTSWNEQSLYAGLRLPLLLTNSRFSQRLSIGANYELLRVENYSVPRTKYEQIGNGNLQTVKMNLNYSRLLRMAYRDIYPKWGQRFYASYRDTPFEGKYKGKQFISDLRLYFPGLFPQHSFQLRGGVTYNDEENYAFQTNVLFPRGYSYQIFKNLYTASVYYGLPLAYPDWALGSFMNVQRLRALAFYDYGKGYDNLAGINREYNSFGADFYVDANFLRYPYLVSVGTRFVYVPEKNSGGFYFLLNISGF